MIDYIKLMMTDVDFFSERCESFFAFVAAIFFIFVFGSIFITLMIL